MSRAASPNPEAVIASAAAGDRAAFARIVAEHHEDMRRVCTFMTRDAALADDATQAAWAIAWRKLDTVRQPERLRPWLLRVAFIEAKHILRRQRRRAEIESVTDASARAGGTDPATEVEIYDLRVAMGRLEPDERALLALRYGAGLNATELSTVLGLSPSGVRTRLERLIKRMREELSDD